MKKPELAMVRAFLLGSFYCNACNTAEGLRLIHLDACDFFALGLGVPNGLVQALLEAIECACHDHSFQVSSQV